MKKKVLFIIGSGRTGSTLLTLILGSHPKCFALGELNKLYRYHKKRQPLCGVCNNACKFWEKTISETELKNLTSVLGKTRINKYVPFKVEKKIREIFNQDRIFNPYSYLFSKREEKVLIDSSKDVDWVTERLKAKEFTTGSIESYLVHMVRDGRAVMNSILRIRPRWTASEFSHPWVAKFKQVNQFYDQFSSDRKITIAYEKFVTNPQGTLAEICQLLEIEFVPEMLQYWKSDHHPVAGNSGTRSLIWKYRGEKVIEEVQKFQGNYYEQIGLSLKLDLRWQNELSLEQLEEFNQIAGDPYEWNG